MNHQQYDDISALYDKLIPEPDNIFKYYCDFAKPGNRVLDLGCGTGRLSFLLAEIGADVTSVDISAGMIEKIKLKLENLPFLKDRINLEVSSATEFKSDEKFDLIIMSGGVFEYLLTPFQQKKALENIKYSLKDDGTFVFDIITPPTIVPYSKRVSDGGSYPTSTRNQEKYNIKSWDVIKADHFKQIVQTTCYFEIFDKEDKLLNTKDFKFLSRYTYPSEMMHLLKAEGFLIKNFYGDYNKNPFGRNSEFMVYECAKEIQR